MALLPVRFQLQDILDHQEQIREFCYSRGVFKIEAFDGRVAGLLLHFKLSQDPSSRISAAAGIQEHIRDHLGGTVQVYSWHDLPPTVRDAIEALTQELPT